VPYDVEEGLGLGFRLHLIHAVPLPST
jgi:hypothetical protein